MSRRVVLPSSGSVEPDTFGAKTRTVSGWMQKRSWSPVFWAPLRGLLMSAVVVSKFASESSGVSLAGNASPVSSQIEAESWPGLIAFAPLA